MKKLKGFILPIKLLFFVTMLFLPTKVSYASNIVDFKTSVSKIIVKANELFAVKIDISIDNRYYTYSFSEQVGPDGIGPTTSELVNKSKELVNIKGKIQFPKPKRKFDDGFQMQLDYYKGNFSIEIPLIAKKDLDFSKDKLNFEFVFQFCDSVSCLPPDYYKVNWTTNSYESNFSNSLNKNTDSNVATLKENNTNSKQIEEKQSTVTTNNDEEVKSKSQTEIESKKEEGVWSFIWFAMSAGALALLTPCVFPMVPITVSFFTKRAEKQGGNALRDSVVYAGGIIFTFTALGFLLALIFGATGIRDFAANGWVNLFIAAIFIVFAFNLFGAFEIQLPTGLLNLLNTKSNESSGIVSLLLMSLTFSLTSFTCTVPFVGSALISASGGEWFYPIIGMLAFSGVFAIPFVLLAIFPSYLKKMPKAGGWMNNVKVAMGFLEIAAALKFISNADLVWAWGVLPKELFLAIWIAIAFLIGFYLMGVFRFPHDSQIESVGSMRALFVTFFFSIAFYLMIGLWDKPLGELDAFLPPSEYREIMSSSLANNASILSTNQSSSKKENINWLTNLDEAKKISKEQNKPIFIDFTGFTCTNCRWMEQNYFKKDETIELFSNYVLVKLYTDRLEEPYISNKKLQEEKFGSIELPMYAIISTNGNVIGTETFTRDYNQFLNFLKLGISK